MVDQTIERRAFARIEINSTIEYFLDNRNTPLAGMLDNMSPGGFLLWTEQTLPLGAKVFIAIDSDKEVEAPIEITATVIRINDEKLGANFGYGCLIEDVIEVS
ncbi:MAG: PilZ domain-containing protein [Candidatus Competibacteraceae bacterium]